MLAAVPKVLEASWMQMPVPMAMCAEIIVKGGTSPLHATPWQNSGALESAGSGFELKGGLACLLASSTTIGRAGGASNEKGQRGEDEKGAPD